MARNLQCLRMFIVAILFLLLVHGIVGDTKDGSDGNNPKPNSGPSKIKCTVRNPINGQYKEDQDKIEYTCNNGFKLHGKKKSKCMNGKLNHEPPVCTAPGCQVIHLNKNLNMTEPIGYKGRVIEFSCDPGYTLKGPGRIHCNGERWSKGQPQCIEDPVSTTSPTPPRHTDVRKPSSVFWITLPPPPRESPTIFSSRWTTVHSSVQSSAVDITSLPPTTAPDSYATTTADFDDIASSISTEHKALQSSAVTEAPTTAEIQEDIKEETLEDYSPSTFHQSTSKATTQMDDDTGVSRSEISGKSDVKPVLLTSPAAITEIDEPESSTIDKLPSSPAGDFPPPHGILGHTDAVTSKEVEMGKATSPKIDDPMTEVEQVKSEPLNVIASTAADSKQDKITPEPMKSTIQDGDEDKDTRHVTNEAQATKSSTTRSIFLAAAKSSPGFKDETYENSDYQVTVVLIVLAVVAACVLLALVTYVVAIKVKAYRSRDQTQDEQAAVAYERGLNGSSAVNGADDNCRIITSL